MLRLLQEVFFNFGASNGNQYFMIILKAYVSDKLVRFIFYLFILFENRNLY